MSCLGPPTKSRTPKSQQLQKEATWSSLSPSRESPAFEGHVQVEAIQIVTAPPEETWQPKFENTLARRTQQVYKVVKRPAFKRLRQSKIPCLATGIRSTAVYRSSGHSGS